MRTATLAMVSVTLCLALGLSVMARQDCPAQCPNQQADEKAHPEVLTSSPNKIGCDFFEKNSPCLDVKGFTCQEWIEEAKVKNCEAPGASAGHCCLESRAKVAKVFFRCACRLVKTEDPKNDHGEIFCEEKERKEEGKQTVSRKTKDCGNSK